MSINKTALIIYEMQNDLCNGGSLAFEGALEIIPTINRIRDKFSKCFFINNTFPKNHALFTNNNNNNSNKIEAHCLNDSIGSEIVKGLVHQSYDYIIKKNYLQSYHSTSGFFVGENMDTKDPTELKRLLDKNCIKHLYFCGNGADEGIMSTIIDALKFGHKCYIIQNAITFKNKEENEKNLKKFLKTNNVEYVTY